MENQQYKRRINAWCMYDWANSAFATTILAAVLPIYYSQVAGANLPSEAVATAYWSLGLSVSLLVVAILSPILGTISDIMRGKKRFLSIFAGLGIIGTGLLVLVDTGDWFLASLLFVLGRIGFSGANVFYDALLPHVARPEDRDRVSTRGYAMGYLGGGLLLAINVVMLQFLPGTWGPRLSFLSVAIWWTVFSIPVLRRVPEPPSATASLEKGESVLSASLNRLRETFKDIRRYQELFKYLIAFFIYNDGIGTIMGVAAIYGAELGFGTVDMVLALLLVQFVGIPFSLIFGNLPNKNEGRRPIYLAFILFSLICLPLVGIIGSRVMAVDLTGAAVEPYENTPSAVGEGIYLADDPAFDFQGGWQQELVPAEETGEDEDQVYLVSDGMGARYDLAFNGQKLELTYSTGPDYGIWAVELDGEPYLKEDELLLLDGYGGTVRYAVTEPLQADDPGEHVLTLINTGERNPESSGTRMTLAQVEVLSPIRISNLGMIIGLIIAIELVGALLAFLFGRQLFSGLVQKLDTRRSIILALVVYAVVAVWGFILDSTLEFWLLAWMVAMVQGGSQALSRSLYAHLSPAAKSGEFFGFYGVMEKFSAIIGPLLFAVAVVIFGNSRPAILSLVALFVIGIFLLNRVDVAEGHRVAQEEDAQLLGAEGP